MTQHLRRFRAFGPHLTWLALLLAGTPSVAGAQCPGLTLSHIGLAVTGAIDFDDQTLTDSSVMTRCNSAPRSSSFGDNWLLDTPHVWGQRPDPTDPEDYSRAPAFFQLVANQIEQTEASLDLAMLSPDQTVMDNWLAPALRRLNDRVASTNPGGPYPLVRVFHGNYFPTAQGVYDLLTAQLGPEPWYVNVVSVKVNHGATVGWQHAKTIVRDSTRVIAGGHIMTRRPLDPTDPLADISIQLEGDAAVAASRFMDFLWQERTGTVCSWGDCGALPASPTPPAPGSHPALAVFSLSRGFRSGGDLDRSADDAITAAFEAAQDHIYMVQHGLDFCLLGSEIQCGMSDVLRDLIVDATIRGTEVKIVLGAPQGLEGAMQISYDVLDQAIEDALDELPWAPDDPRRLETHCRLQVAPYRSWNDPVQRLESHAKFFSIDGRAFYVGSQNLYPSGFVTDTGAMSGIHHTEHGFLVDDAALTAEIDAQYWNRVWSYSSQYLLESSIIERDDCPAGGDPGPGPGPEMCDGLDNDADGEIDEDEVCNCRDEVYQGRDYRFCEQPVIWSAAADACAAMGTSLVEVDDPAENTWLATEGAPIDRWIGLTDAASEDDWRWLDGSPLGAFDSWGPHEPNGGTDENCAQLYPSGEWNDLDCAWLQEFVCEGEPVETCNGLDDDGDGQTDEDDVCDCRTVSFGGSDYRFCDAQVNWADAVDACSVVGAELVEVDGFSENAWLASEGAPVARWIGLTDAFSEGVWHWVDGSALSGFAGWGPMEPNGNARENCAQLYPNGEWNDLNCGWVNGFVCQSTPIPEGDLCLTGNLIYDDFIYDVYTGPVDHPVSVAIDDGPFDWIPLGQLAPDVNGRFCLPALWSRRYLITETVDQPVTRQCSAVIEPSDPGAAGTCGVSESGCEELGDVDFFCGS